MSHVPQVEIMPGLLVRYCTVLHHPPPRGNTEPILFFYLQGQTNWVHNAASGPDGRLPASCGADDTIEL